MYRWRSRPSSVDVRRMTPSTTVSSTPKRLMLAGAVGDVGGEEADRLVFWTMLASWKIFSRAISGSRDLVQEHRDRVDDDPPGAHRLDALLHHERDAPRPGCRAAG